MEKRKLYRSESDRMVGGVCGGLGDYLDIDSTLVRIIFVALALMGGPGFLVYLILLIIVPSEEILTSRSKHVVDSATVAEEVEVEVLED
jgi:phage shock protein C